MPTLPLCNTTFMRIYDIECAEAVASKYFRNFLLDLNSTHCNNQRPCSITEYSGHTILHATTASFSQDMLMNQGNDSKEGHEKGFAMAYTFDLPEEVSVFKEEQMFDFFQLVGNLGGTFSLFTGFSFFGSFGWILIRTIAKCWYYAEKNHTLSLMG